MRRGMYTKPACLKALVTLEGTAALTHEFTIDTIWLVHGLSSSIVLWDIIKLFWTKNIHRSSTWTWSEELGVLKTGMKSW